MLLWKKQKQKMNKIKNVADKDADEKEENHLDKILDSNACRKLFAWASPKDSSIESLDAEIKEQQRHRWNFDFDTETPLPGRYQWVRVEDASNSPQKNGNADCNKIQNGVVERRIARQRLNSPYSRKSGRPKTEEHSSNLKSAGSCDISLNGPRRSERKSQVQPNDSPYGLK